MDYKNNITRSIEPALPIYRFETEYLDGTKGYSTDTYNDGIALYLVDDDFCSKSPPVLSSWGEWSSCNKVCKGGTRSRLRTCEKICWTVTQDDLTETEPCNDMIECDPCGEVFPFGLFSNDTRVIIEELILNQGYQIRLAETGEFSIFKCLADTV